MSNMLPTWEIAELPKPKPIGLKNLTGFIGPGIVMCGIQIGGGEWLLGPEITAKYGGTLMWIATIAIICQIFYNIECGRYALYTGEPVFTGFMRNRPGPSFWIGVFALFNIGALIPALSTTASAVVVALFIGEIPNRDYNLILLLLSYVLFGLVTLPVLVGGKIYNTLEKIMTAKVIIVLTFCLFIGFFFVSPANWGRVFGGFLAFGNVPVERNEDRNANGILDPGEDWDRDGHLDQVEPRFEINQLLPGNQLFRAYDSDGDHTFDLIVKEDPAGTITLQDEPNRKFTPVNEIQFALHGKETSFAVRHQKKTSGSRLWITLDQLGTLKEYPLHLTSGLSSKHPSYIDLDDDHRWDGDNVDNLFSSLFSGLGFPLITLANIAVLGAFAGYAGGGGLSNSTYSNFVRDKGWGMGSQVGAIPSVVGGRGISLSHIGKTFEINTENLSRWKGWWKYILTDQVMIWGPGCFMGMALPGLISIQFSEYSSFFTDSEGLAWSQALITADGLKNAPGLWGLNSLFWTLTVLVGLMVLLPSQMSIIDDVCRRWTDIFWSGLSNIRDTMAGKEVGRIYYRIMALYVVWSLVMQTVFLYFSDAKGMVLTVANTNNLSLGLTAILILYNNHKFLPKEIRPRLIHTLGMIGCATFYLGMTLLVFAQKPEVFWFFGLFACWILIWWLFVRNPKRHETIPSPNLPQADETHP
ncbi:MAG: Nramp family divalent metal transporter [Planctomycetota bacterium]|nr:Nramp family divalent metal transporter [Planctomycetota bacterium]